MPMKLEVKRTETVCDVMVKALRGDGGQEGWGGWG